MPGLTPRRRVFGKHVEIVSVTFESVQLPPEIANAAREREAAALRASKQKLEKEAEWANEKLELEHNVERQRLKREAEGPH